MEEFKNPYSSDPGVFRWLLEASYAKYIDVSSAHQQIRDFQVTETYYQGLKELIKKYFTSNGNLIDCGCGLGRVSFEAAALNFNVTGIDNVEKYIGFIDKLKIIAGNKIEIEIPKVGKKIRKAMFEVPKQYAINQTNFMVEDVLKIPFNDGYFDYAISSNVIDRLENPIKSMYELYRILRKGGRAIIISPLDWRIEFTNKTNLWISNLTDLLTDTNKWKIIGPSPELSYLNYKLRITDRFTESYMCDVLIVEKR